VSQYQFAHHKSNYGLNLTYFLCESGTLSLNAREESADDV
jgi:hypothetical protein